MQCDMKKATILESLAVYILGFHVYIGMGEVIPQSATIDITLDLISSTHQVTQEPLAKAGRAGFRLAKRDRVTYSSPTNHYFLSKVFNTNLV